MTLISVSPKSSFAVALLCKPSLRMRTPLSGRVSAPPIPWTNAGHDSVEVISTDRALRRVPLPTAGSFSAYYDGAALAEAYAIALPDRITRDSFKTALELFENLPVWLRLGSRISATATDMEEADGFRGAPRTNAADLTVHIGCFHIYSYTPDEITVGWANRHLSFRIAALLQRSTTGAAQIVVTTTVHCNDVKGKQYLRRISQLYRLALTSRLRRFAAAEWKKRENAFDDGAGWLSNTRERATRLLEWLDERRPRLADGSLTQACRDCVAPARLSKKEDDGLAHDAIFYPPYRDMYPALTKTDYVSAFRASARTVSTSIN